MARYLQYMDRSKRYISTIQFILILLMYLNMKADLTDWLFYALSGLVIIGMLVIGFIDKKIGIYEAEQDYIASHNPQVQKIIKMIEEK